MGTSQTLSKASPKRLGKGYVERAEETRMAELKSALDHADLSRDGCSVRGALGERLEL